MAKIVLFEKMGVLKLRIENIVNRMEKHFVETHSTALLDMGKLDYMLNDVSVVIVDMDYIDDTVESVVKKLQSNVQKNNPALILMTSKLEKKMLLKVSECTLVELLVKPFVDDDLYGKINRLLQGLNEPMPKKKMISKEKSEPKAKESDFLKWDDSYSIGIEHIDQEHRQLIEVFGALYRKVAHQNGKECFQKLIDFVEVYVKAHIESEERFQKAIDFEFYEDHKTIHREFLAQVEHRKKAHKGKHITNHDLIEINLFMREWLLHHILVEDKKIGVFFNKL